MSNLRKVTYARLHTTVHIIGVGQVGGSKEVRSTAASPGKLGYDLYKHAEGLLIKGNSFEVLVPAPNIQMLALAPEEASSADKTGLVTVGAGSSLASQGAVGAGSLAGQGGSLANPKK